VAPDFDFASRQQAGTMPTGGTDGLDVLLLAGLALVLAGIGFIGAIEAWRRWSHNRRMKNHFRN